MEEKMESSSNIISFNHLPGEAKLKIFGYLPFKDVMKYSCVSKEWKVFLEDKSIWKIFSIKANVPYKHFVTEKSIVVKRISWLVKNAKGEGKESPLEAQIILSRLGIGSLNETKQKAEEYFREYEEDVNYKDNILYKLAKEYLKQNLFFEVEDILAKMIKGVLRTEIASNVFCLSIKSGDLKRALSVIHYLDDPSIA
jgi:hypothetical protein